MDLLNLRILPFVRIDLLQTIFTQTLSLGNLLFVLFALMLKFIIFEYLYTCVDLFFTKRIILNTSKC